MYALLKKNSAFFTPYLIFLLAGTNFLLFSTRNNISLFINGHHNSQTDFFFSHWTDVGLGYLIIPVALFLAFVSFRSMLMSVITYLIAFGVNDGIKFALGTPRPAIVFSQINQDFYHVPGVDIYYWNSFPSGHTAISFALFCILALVIENRTMKFLFFTAALLVGYSRIYLAEHFITDVIGGSIIGVSSAVLCYELLTHWKALDKFANIDRPLINIGRK